MILRDSDLLEAGICIIDDEPANVLLLQRILEYSGYSNVVSFTDPRAGWDYITSNEIDLLALDLQMPKISGLEILERLKPQNEETIFTPIMVLTADATITTRRQSINLGAHDFLTKPFEAIEVAMRVKNLLRMRLALKKLAVEGNMPETELKSRLRLREREELEIVGKLASPSECPQEDAKTHRERIGTLSAALAAELGMDEAFVRDIQLAAQLYDVGKIGISNEILLKPGKLTPEEFEMMKRHTEIGASILSGSNSSVMAMAEQIAFSHHERWDGRGYPCGLKGNDIPISGRIVAVIDVFDALTHERSYKQAWTTEAALEAIRENSGAQFDPNVVEAFMRCLERPENQVA
ncbi:MAG: response regulator [Armatimonadetes bacterium]|nr:response regulator [Armatimonadota bacterium]MBS1700285.1 response regulator [Armatimonadota bacterium]MBS1728629.1 response regulator [Armatimonadota bacterium]